MNEVHREQLEVVEQFENSMGLATGFFRSLKSEEDWSFVIKSHALIESSVGHVLTLALGDNRLDRYIATLDLCGGRHSKVTLARTIDMLDSDEEMFIRAGLRGHVSTIDSAEKPHRWITL